MGFPAVGGLLAFVALGTVSGSRTEPSLCTAARGCFRIGAAIQSAQLRDPKKVSLILSQFNCLTAEYEFMPSIVHPMLDRYNFGPADRIVDFAQAHGLPLTGHMLCWHQMTPDWMFEDPQHKPLPRPQGLANLKRHIEAVMAHFKDKVESWNVVNEAVSDKPSEYLRDTPALRSIGPDYVLKAFEFAHEADPMVPLYYNDYNVEDPIKLPKVIRLIRSLRQAGVTLDAVGIQGHWLLDYPDASTIEAGIVALGKERVKILVTELDVDVAPRDGTDPYKDALPPVVSGREAKRYADLFAVFLRHRDLIPRVTLWGLEDGQSWLNYTPLKRVNYPLLFDRNLRPKAAFLAVMRRLIEDR
jgi:endo-1,4-beta-xylanase